MDYYLPLGIKLTNGDSGTIAITKQGIKIRATITFCKYIYYIF